MDAEAVWLCGWSGLVLLTRSRGQVVLELVTVEGADRLTDQGGELVDG